MSEKFDMKVVIDPVTTPLLHARLAQAKSYRERAAVLRHLAEAALRGVPAQTASSIVETAATASTAASTPAMSSPYTTLPLTASRNRPPAEPAVSMLPVAAGAEPSNEQGSLDGHNVEALADAFGGYF
ncbi:hypothetical protein R75461_07410 [Paraburkholderia nemoris]|uniref:hypothetical protein n=1 Tax=Paraburkholderia TaxID=1822464 RepID=UPI00190B52BA|nr:MULTISPECIES: hypothetical protein [Paraburkholderia]MBK3786249.1 hypothetical protein [Paraburkholderia aspalathi]CAE6849648.1 hypothetical protein R75461_07410 [Paraburkholderia nemoris]